MFQFSLRTFPTVPTVRTWKIRFNNQGLFKLVIISFILMTLVFVSAGSAILRINYLPVTVSEG